MILTKAAYLSYQNGPQEKSILIDKKVTIGREIGELILADQSISPRHCTFILNQDVICLIDHSSITGTFINKKKIEPGRTFIVSEKDDIKVGNLKIRVELKEIPDGMEDQVEEEETAEEQEELSYHEFHVAKDMTQSGVGISQLLNFSIEENISTKESSSDQESNSLLTDLNEDGEEYPDDISNIDVEKIELDPDVLEYGNAKGRRNRREKVKSTAQVKNRKISKNKFYSSSTHIIFRFFAFTYDFIMWLTVYNIIGYQQDIHSFILSIGKGYTDYIYVPYIKNFWMEIRSQLPMVEGFASDIAEHSFYDVGVSFLICFFILRVLVIFSMGVSLGQYIIGVRSVGSEVQKRVMGVVREFLFWITCPFIIFDLPAFFGKRTFKEIVTRTQLYTLNNISSVILTIFFLPILLVGYLFSPMFRGFDYLENIEVRYDNTQSKSWEYHQKYYSNLLELSYDSSKDLQTLPSFKVEAKNQKRYLTFGIVFVDLKNNQFIEVRKYKSFSLENFYKDFIEENFLAQYFWPNIYKYQNNLKAKNLKHDEKLSDGVVVETEKIIEGIYSLSLKTIPEFILKNGPIMSAHRNFREKLDHKIYGSSPQKLDFIQFAQAKGILGKHSSELGQEYFTFIPLRELDSKIYHFSIDLLNPANALFVNQFLIEENKDNIEEDPISKLLLGFSKDPSFEDYNLSQYLYERYFELGKRFMLERNVSMKDQLILNINRMISVLSENKLKNKKLYLNLNELVNALKKESWEFFNIESTRTVKI